ncbi:hypothetical protein LOTGIDRAFT_175420 [Lottia gigantea]|uniref:Uncharacterized protein n=1 Tax=Lottia gigantea TaxID=225164 RepID=V4AC76_LOTGI|nr:hypothetical protein LOTGIDRAFT_175420 [Lottia gigantea]ESO94422.1 hypothetical protein LOTGIDRAFT_175420 [Lottia gigantea]
MKIHIDNQVNGDDISGSVTCDNILNFFVDGQLEASSNDWKVGSPVSFSDTAHVLAFDCRDEGVIAGIRGSFSNGVVTDSSWRCSTSDDEGWKELGFDDSNWQDATIQTHSDWGNKPTSIASEAKWIWTAGDFTDRHVFCRRRLHPGTRLDLRLDQNDKPKPGEEPVNRVDAAALKHDILYRNKDITSRHEADKQMIIKLENIPNPTFKERIQRALIIKLLKAKMKMGMGIADEIHKKFRNLTD